MEQSTIIFSIIGGGVGLWLLVMATIAIIRDSSKYHLVYKFGKKRIYMLTRTKKFFDQLTDRTQTIVESDITNQQIELPRGKYLAVIDQVDDEQGKQCLCVKNRSDGITMEETFRNYFNFSTEQSYTSTSPIDHTLMGRERSVQKGEQMEFPVYHFHEDGTITLSSTEYPGRFVYVPEDFDYETEVVRWKEDCDFRQGQYDEYHEQKKNNRRNQEQ